MINKIGVENFRVFKDYTEFELRPLTLLTGPNNAGKSSLTKLLLLLNNGLQELNFKEGIHNLEDYKNSLNRDCNNENLHLTLYDKIDILESEVKMDLYYNSKGIIEKLEISTNSINIITFTKKYSMIEDVAEYQLENEFGEIETHEDWDFTDYCDYNLSFNINYIIQLFYDNKIIFEEAERKRQIRNEIESIPKDYLLYDLIVDGENCTSNNIDLLLKFQKTEFAKNVYSFDTDDPNFVDKNVLIEECNNAITTLSERIKMKIYYKIENEKIFKNSKIEIIENYLGDLIFNKTIFEDDFSFNIVGKSYKIINNKKEIIKHFSNFRNNFNHYEYISPMRGNQKRVLFNKSESAIDELAAKVNIKLQKKYLEAVLPKIGISGIIDIKRDENTISIISIKKDENDENPMNLADFGFGYSQLIPIILKIIDCQNKKQYNLIIEEPEANLHPTLQSILADIFVLTLEHFKDFNFIIETHSVYFIKKLQLLTAKKQIATNKSVIYYFSSDNLEPLDIPEPKVKKIEIDEFGRLSDEFGKGFFDEENNLSIDLFMLKYSQNN